MNRLASVAIVGLIAAVVLASSAVYLVDSDDYDAASGERSSQIIDNFGDFLKEVEDSNYNYDGKGVTVKWSPTSGCWDGKSHAGHQVEIPEQDGNTPKRANSSNFQYQIFENLGDISISNVNFEFSTTDVGTIYICLNSGWAGPFSGNDYRNAELQFLNTGSLKISNCSFDHVVVSPFRVAGTLTVSGCQFENNWDTYAFKDIKSSNISIEGCTFDNLGGGIMIGNSDKSGITRDAISIQNNTFKDIGGNANENEDGEDKRYTRGLIQFKADNSDHDNYSNVKIQIKGNILTYSSDVSVPDRAGAVRHINANLDPAKYLKQLITDNSFPIFPFVNNSAILIYVDPSVETSGDGKTAETPVKTIGEALTKAEPNKFINLYFVGGGEISGTIPSGKVVSLNLNGKNVSLGESTITSGGYLVVSSGVLYVDDDTLRSQVIGTTMKSQSSSSSEKVEVKTETVETVAEKTGSTTAIVSEIKSEENVSQAIIEAVTQISTVKTVTESTSSTETVTIQVVVPVAKDTKKVEVSNAAVTALKDSGAELKVSDSGGRTVSLDNDVLETLSSKTGTVEVIVTPEPTTLTTAQKSVVGTDTVIDVSAYVGGEQVSKLNGTATISVPYQAKGTVKVTYVKDDGSVENVPCTYSGGVVTFTTNHFSLFVFSDSSSTPSFIPVPDNRGDDFPGYIPTQKTDSASDDSAKIAVLVGAIVVVLVAIVALVHRSR